MPSENLVKTRIINNWEAQDEPEHLRTIRDRLFSLKHLTLPVLQQYRKIIKESQIPISQSLEHTELLLSGLVIKQEGMLEIANRIYAIVFDLNWVNKAIERLNSHN